MVVKSTGGQRHVQSVESGLVDAEGTAHGGLDVEALDVLPVLLQERDEEVHGETDVEVELVGLHLDVTDGDVHADDLLKLELDGRLHLLNLVGDRGLVVDEGGELASLVETRAEETGDQLDDGGRGKEDVVLAS